MTYNDLLVFVLEEISDTGTWRIIKRNAKTIYSAQVTWTHITTRSRASKTSQDQISLLGRPPTTICMTTS